MLQVRNVILEKNSLPIAEQEYKNDVGRIQLGYKIQGYHSHVEMRHSPRKRLTLTTTKHRQSEVNKQLLTQQKTWSIHHVHRQGKQPPHSYKKNIVQSTEQLMFQPMNIRGPIKWTLFIGRNGEYFRIFEVTKFCFEDLSS